MSKGLALLAAKNSNTLSPPAIQLNANEDTRKI